MAIVNWDYFLDNLKKSCDEVGLILTLPMSDEFYDELIRRKKELGIKE